MEAVEALSLSALNALIAGDIVADKRLQNVWVVAETGDVRVSGGHCYFELIEKDTAGHPVARMRAIIWASQFARLNAEFRIATGRSIESDMKIMVRVSINFHAAFGLSAVVSDINPEFTCGDIMRRRREIINRLTAEGIIDMNRTLPWSDTPLRIAVISAKGAAGYGDFITQLYTNPSRLNFSTRLFPAVMQGENAPQSVIAALEQVASECDSFDCAVIIRGGGATGDLSCFDNYELAANVAQFPLPVIVGIGHERDTTVLDDIASVRVKTPTAAAEWLISKVETALTRVKDIASEIFRLATAKISGNLQQLAYYQGLIPTLALAKIEAAHTALEASIPDAIRNSIVETIRRNTTLLDNHAALIDALSPKSVLSRGYSITRVNGHAVTDAATLIDGDTITTVFASGSVNSTVNK